MFTVPRAIDRRNDNGKLSGKACRNPDACFAREVASFFVETRQCGYRGTQRVHWLGVSWKILDRPSNPLRNFIRRGDICPQLIKLGALWQTSIPEQKDNFFERGLSGEVMDVNSLVN